MYYIIGLQWRASSRMSDGAIGLLQVVPAATLSIMPIIEHFHRKRNIYLSIILCLGLGLFVQHINALTQSARREQSHHGLVQSSTPIKLTTTDDLDKRSTNNSQQRELQIGARNCHGVVSCFILRLLSCFPVFSRLFDYPLCFTCPDCTSSLVYLTCLPLCPCRIVCVHPLHYPPCSMPASCILLSFLVSSSVGQYFVVFLLDFLFFPLSETQVR